MFNKTGKLAALKVAKGKSMKIRHLRDAVLRKKKYPELTNTR